MKRKLLIAVSAVLILGLLLMPNVGFASESKVSDEVDLAQKAGQLWLDDIARSTGDPSNWIGACLTEPQVYCDLKGQPNAYVFAIENKGIVGHIIVGAADYSYHGIRSR